MKKIPGLAIAAFFLVYIVPLGIRPMVMPDEFRYAEIPREMLATGNWIVPHLDGLRYFEKPVLGYWLNAISIAAFGENAFAIRFFSALGAGICAYCVFLLARWYSRDRFTGLLAALVFLTSIEVFVVSTLALLDGMFTTFLTVAMTAGFFADIEERTWRKAGLLSLFGLCCGLAFLVKGFLAFAVAGVAIVPYLIWQRRTAGWFKLMWLWAGAAVLIALPWSLAIYAHEKDFWNRFFWVEHVRRFLSATSAEHPEPSWFFVPILLAGAFPWVLLLPSIFLGMKKLDFKNSLLRYAACWVLLPFIFFSASRGKLSTYILPCFPPLAVLVTMALMKRCSDTNKKVFAPAAYIITVIAAVLSIALVVGWARTIQTASNGVYETFKAIAGLAGLLGFAYILLVFCARRSEDHKRQMLYFATGMLVFLFSTPFSAPDVFFTEKAPAEFLKQHRDRVGPNDILVSDNYLASGLCWIYQRDDVFLVGGLGELEYGLKYDDSKYRVLDAAHINEPPVDVPAGGHIILITLSRRYKDYRKIMPEPTYEDVRDDYTFAEFDPVRPSDNSAGGNDASSHHTGPQAGDNLLSAAREDNDAMSSAAGRYAAQSPANLACALYGPCKLQPDIPTDPRPMHVDIPLSNLYRE